MENFTSPLSLTDEQRKANSAALQLRMASVMDRVAAKSANAQARSANTRDAATARKMAKRMAS